LKRLDSEMNKVGGSENGYLFVNEVNVVVVSDKADPLQVDVYCYQTRQEGSLVRNKANLNQACAVLGADFGFPLYYQQKTVAHSVVFKYARTSIRLRCDAPGKVQHATVDPKPVNRKDDLGDQ
jgi:hypothetical protein